MDISKQYILWRASRIEGWLMKEEPSVIYDLATKFITNGSIAAEIGSWKGKSTYIIASVCKKVGARLIAIDTFEGSLNSEDIANLPGGAYYEAKINNENFFHDNIETNLRGLPVTYLKMSSHQASQKIKNHSLDFCFIDGDHTLPVVYEDIKDYLPKVKKNKILLGHDYSNTVNPNNHVRQSVDKLIGAKNINLTNSIWTYIQKK